MKYAEKTSVSSSRSRADIIESGIWRVRDDCLLIVPYREITHWRELPDPPRDGNDHD